MRIPEEVLQSIRTRISIVDVVGAHVALKRSGKSWKGLCPFHSEKTPSFVVNEERGTYHCFGCGAGGSVFRFLMETEGRSFLEVVRDLAGRAGVALELGPEDSRQRRVREEREVVLELLALAARYYRHQLKEGRAGGRARAYLAHREIPDETVEEFGLGCAPAGWDHLARYLSTKGVDLGLAARAGLVAERASGGYYDRLRDRLVFPITDSAGRVVSFGGRVLGDGEPKYLNGPESPVFKKGQLLYGLYQAREALRRNRRALLVEGYLDVISLHARGFDAALATLGTALTADHVHLLRRRADEAVLVYDGDEAGRRAAFRSLDLLLSEGFPCRGVLLPPEHDPDSFVRQGGDLWTLLEEARSLFEVYLGDLMARTDLSGVEGRLAAVAELAPRLAAVSDPLARDLYCRSVAETLGVEESHLRRRLRATKVNAARQDPTRAPEPPPDSVEKALLESLLHEPGHRSSFLTKGVEAWMQPGTLREAARFVSQRPEGPEAFPLDDTPDPIRAVLAEVLVRTEGPRTGYEVLENTLELRHVKGKLTRTAHELSREEARGNHVRVQELMREQAELGRTLVQCQARLGKKSP